MTINRTHYYFPDTIKTIRPVFSYINIWSTLYVACIRIAEPANENVWARNSETASSSRLKTFGFFSTVIYVSTDRSEKSEDLAIVHQTVDNNDRSCGGAKARNIFLKDHMKITETFRTHTGGRGVVARSPTTGINTNNYNTQLRREFENNTRFNTYVCVC